jgi:hypothetical protein
MSYEMKCRTCSVPLGRRWYEAAGLIACRPCAVKVNPASVARQDKVLDARGIHDTTAAERLALSFDRPTSARADPAKLRSIVDQLAASFR